MLENIVVYTLSGFLILGALCVILSNNPVYSVLFLIFTFFNAAGIFIFLKAEFLAVALVIIYVGAVAVLFLFVVMLINVKENTTKKHLTKYFLFSLVLVLVLGAEFIFFIKNGLLNFTRTIPAENIGNNLYSVKQLGVVLYENYYYVFILAGLILTVAMIGAVVLSDKESDGENYTQDVAIQNNRSKAKSVYTVKVNNEEGTK